MGTVAGLGSNGGLLGSRLYGKVLDADPAKLAVVLRLIAAQRTPAERTGGNYAQGGRCRLHGRMCG